MEKYFTNPISEKIWQDRYRKNGETYEENLRRVADFVASAETENSTMWADIFYDLMLDGVFFPGGRTMSNAAIGEKLTSNNCFSRGIIGDSLPLIFDAVKLGAITHKAGGGIGYNFSGLSPRGRKTHNDAIASGPVSFMDVFNTQTSTIQQGSRRGANMGCMSVYHPDIFEFLEAKATDANRLNHFNISVIVDDKFMAAVQDELNIALHWPIYDDYGNKLGKDQWDPQYTKEYPAKELWELIMKKAYDNGEPGIFFEDTMNRLNPAYYVEQIVCSNPSVAA